MVHGWWMYVEDRALSWSGRPPARRTRSLDALVDHAVAVLHHLLELP